MPDRTHPSGIMNLRDPYDIENYYSEQFMQENLDRDLQYGFDPQWSKFLRATQPDIFDLDPESDEYAEKLYGAADQFVKNKYDYEDELISTNRSLLFSMLF